MGDKWKKSRASKELLSLKDALLEAKKEAMAQQKELLDKAEAVAALIKKKHENG